MRTAILALLAASTSIANANAAVIINDSTLGYYTSSLGNLATIPAFASQTDTGTGFNLFPNAGDPLIPNASAPNLAVAGAPADFATFLGTSAPTGGGWSAAPVAIPGTWAVGSETAIVYEFNAGAGLSNITVSLGVDNGIFVWLNGQYQFGAIAPGGFSANEYSFTLPDLSGVNYLQVLREDHGGLTGYTIQVTGDRTVPAPEPGSLIVLGAGLALAGIARRRR